MARSLQIGEEEKKDDEEFAEIAGKARLMCLLKLRPQFVLLFTYRVRIIDR